MSYKYIKQIKKRSVRRNLIVCYYVLLPTTAAHPFVQEGIFIRQCLTKTSILYFVRTAADFPYDRIEIGCCVLYSIQNFEVVNGICSFATE